MEVVMLNPGTRRISTVLFKTSYSQTPPLEVSVSGVSTEFGNLYFQQASQGILA